MWATPLADEIRAPMETAANKGDPNEKLDAGNLAAWRHPPLLLDAKDTIDLALCALLRVPRDPVLSL